MKLVALCGYPGAGKSTVQEIISRRFGIEPQDDGLPLRRIAMEMWGLSWEDVFTQLGKKKSIVICGKPYSIRQVLGDLGQILENYFGEQVVPEAALRCAFEQYTSTSYPVPGISFGSVRKTQGLTYRKRGGYVIEVFRPGCVANYAFDEYDKKLVNVTINNTFATVEELEEEVVRAFRILGFVEIDA